MNILNAREYIEAFLKIRTKDGRVIPFKLNKAQNRLYEAIKRQHERGKPVRIVILKARQMGFSTLSEAIIFHGTATAENVDSMIVAHKDEATANLFRMSKRFLDELPSELAPMQKASNAQELVFDEPARHSGKRKGLNSRIRCATAGGSGIGRSYTLRYLHISEFAFWPGDKQETLTGLLQAVPDLPGTVVIIESTANGYDEFKRLWDNAVDAEREGADGFVPIFFPWFEMDEYRRQVRPSFKRTDEEEALAQTYGLDDEQLSWRRWCIATNFNGDVDLFKQEYPSSPDEAFISTGRCAFPKEALVLRRERVRKLNWEYGRFSIEKDITGRILSFRWRQEKDGPIRILKHPKAGVPYVLGGDTAGTGSDKFTGQMIDNRTGEQVAVLSQQFGERAYAEQMYCLGKYYNEALIGVETNYSTFPEMILEEMEYKNLYVRERYDNFLGKTVPAFGFDTNTATRPVIVDKLKDVVRESLECINDYETLGEMLTFVYDEKYKPQAESGEHDDLVMALAIAQAIRTQQRTSVILPEEEGKSWTADMWEDYRNADAAAREYLIKKWGKPR